TRFSRDWSSDVCSSDLPASRAPEWEGSAGELPREVSELRKDELLQRELHRVGRARQREEHLTLRHPGARAREHGRAADLLERERSEERRVGKDGKPR